MLVYTDYKHFLNEAFDIQKYYQFHKIPKFLQDFAKKSLEHIDSQTVPADLKNKMHSVEFWTAKAIKQDMITNIDDVIRKISQKIHIHLDKDLLKNITLNIINDKQINDKFISKFNITEDIKKELKQIINDIKLSLEEYVQSNYDTPLHAIYDYFFSLARDTRKSLNLINASFRDMSLEQAEWHKELKEGGNIEDEKGKILKKYPDGFYWIDTETNSCAEEAAAMGHCGRTRADTILSLRQKSYAGIKPHVTMAVDYDENNDNKYKVIHQIKGKQNTKPIDKYHPYIVDLLTDDKLFPRPQLDLNEYNSKEDFHIYDLKDEPLIKKILDKRHYLFLNDPLIGLSDESILSLYNYSTKIKETDDQYNLLRFYTLKIIDEKELLTRLQKTNNTIVDLIPQKNKIYFTVNDYKDLNFMFGSTRDFDYESSFKQVMSGDISSIFENQVITIDDTKSYLKLINDTNIKKLWSIANKKGSIYEKQPVTIIKTPKDFVNFLNEIDDKKLNKILIDVCNEAQNMSDYKQAYTDCVNSILEFLGVKKIEKEDKKLLIPFNLEWMRSSVKNRSYPEKELKEYLINWFNDHDKLKIGTSNQTGWETKVSEEMFNDTLKENLELNKK